MKHLACIAILALAPAVAAAADKPDWAFPVTEKVLPPSRDEVRILAARFGVEAGMIGAALLAFDGLAQRADVA